MGKEKRVLVLSNMYPGKISQTFGIFVKNQVEAIKDRGMDLDVVAVHDPRMGKPFVLKKYLLWLIRILLVFLTKGRRYDLVHAHYVFPSGLFALWFKKRFGTKIVVTAHGGDIDKMSKKGGFFFKKTKQILQEADYVVAVGENLRRDITETFEVDENKTAVINMGVNRQVFQPMDKGQAKDAVGLSQEKFSLLFVGNLIKQKGLLELLEAYKSLKQTNPHLELHLMGPVKNEEFMNEMKHKIHEEAMKEVHIHPPKDQAEVATWMAAADVFVLPSHMEGFGLVALEAMSCHTPVVGSDVGGLTYLLQDAGVPFEPKNAASLADAVEKVMNSEELRATLIENGERKAWENDQEKLLDNLMDIYDRIGGKAQ
ncbi:glycosyltransferase family 4 protein [Salinibacillus aidingensis]|uniref:Glycosyltransferase family 4 protein n=1 Tax=Salinibacillus aidingensis TaxID=237684 RepID=A0ABN1AZB2_9BACI